LSLISSITSLCGLISSLSGGDEVVNHFGVVITDPADREVSVSCAYLSPRTADNGAYVLSLRRLKYSTDFTIMLTNDGWAHFFHTDNIVLKAAL